MSETRQQKIERGVIIPDGCASEQVERLSIVLWEAERAYDGFPLTWEQVLPATREAVRGGITAVLAAIAEEQE